MEELKLDLIRVVSSPDSIFKSYLIFKDGNANVMAGVYSQDDNWYYLYKQDTEKYRVKRRKDLEKQKPYVLYKPEVNYIPNPTIKNSLSKSRQIAEGGHKVMERDLNGEIQQFFW